MLTDDDLAVLLRRGFAQATEDLDPEPDLVHVLRRRHARARRRRVVVAMAVPAAALAVGSGFAFAGRDVSHRAPSHTALSPPSAPATSGSAPRSTQATPVRAKPASYKLVAFKHKAAPPSNCPANATAPVSKTANPRPGVWFWTNGKCFFVGVGGTDTKPADATPLRIEGFPGLYSTLKNGVRTIYAPGIGGRGWWVLDMPANTPPDVAVRMLVPAN